jgi:hypothetical protein
MEDFFTAKHIDASMREKIERYIDKFAQMYLPDLMERTQFSGDYVCPLCRKAFRHHAMLFSHYRYTRNGWEMSLLKRIYEVGPKGLPLFDVYYEDKGEDVKLAKRIRFWVLCVKIYEHIVPVQMWKDVEEMNSKSYVKRIFWEQDRKVKLS